MINCKKEKPFFIDTTKFIPGDEWAMYQCMLEIQEYLEIQISNSDDQDFAESMQSHLEVVKGASKDLLSKTSLAYFN